MYIMHIYIFMYVGTVRICVCTAYRIPMQNFYIKKQEKALKTKTLSADLHSYMEVYICTYVNLFVKTRAKVYPGPNSMDIFFFQCYFSSGSNYTRAKQARQRFKFQLAE